MGPGLRRRVSCSWMSCTCATWIALRWGCGCRAGMSGRLGTLLPKGRSTFSWSPRMPKTACPLTALFRSRPISKTPRKVSIGWLGAEASPQKVCGRHSVPNQVAALLYRAILCWLADQRRQWPDPWDCWWLTLRHWVTWTWQEHFPWIFDFFSLI